MKCLKVLGFAAVAAVALTAFIGASSASATVLCKTTPAEPNTNSCPSGWDYPSETTFTLTVDQTIHWIAGPIDDTCTSSTVKGKTSTTGGATSTVNGNIETLTFTGCTCPVTVLKPGSLEIHWISGTHNGTLTGKGSEWTVNCSGISCSYGTSATGTVLGKVTSSATSISSATLDIGDPATGKGATLPKLGGSFLCPSTEEWTGSYWITEPVPLYVAETG